MRIAIADGRIAGIEAGAAPQGEDARHDSVIPGIPNLHSHAFQRLMAGLGEARQGPAGDDFWGWRALMYRLIGRIGPTEMQGIAAMAFVEMLESGFTRVAEFHYLHHDPEGRPYADPAEMAAAVAAAAAETGIALTLLPVFYAHAGFGGAAPTEGQRRFVTDLDGYARLRAASEAAVRALPDAIVGVAPHSLRAVAPGELDALATMAPDRPCHIHIAEQTKEVDDCLAWSGKRPVEWLLERLPVDARWCLVHATHVTAAELAEIVARDAIVGLCPVTEANLGDGIFPAARFVEEGGAFGIGSDSNVRIDAAEELRLLEYGQRLTLRRRTLLADATRSNGRVLVEGALAGGARATGGGGVIELGAPADLVALAADPIGSGDRALDRWIFGTGAVDMVWRRGVPVVSGGRHKAREAIARRYREIEARLAS